MNSDKAGRFLRHGVVKFDVRVKPRWLPALETDRQRKENIRRI